MQNAPLRKLNIKRRDSYVALKWCAADKKLYMALEFFNEFRDYLSWYITKLIDMIDEAAAGRGLTFQAK